MSQSHGNPSKSKYEKTSTKRYEQKCDFDSIITWICTETTAVNLGLAST